MCRGFSSTALAIALLAVPFAGAQQPPPFTTLDRATIEQRLNRFEGENIERELTLEQMFGEAGCDSKHIVDQVIPGQLDSNIVCVLPGRTPKTIIVGAHFDHVAGSLGVVDNWSGAALLPSLYQSLKSEPHEHTYVFVGFGAGENEQAGSVFYAKSLTKAQRNNVAGMINVESIGLTPPKVWVKRGNKQLADALFAVAAETKQTVTNVDMPETTDSESFRAEKMPVVTIHSLTQEAWNAKAIHGNQDQLTAINLDTYYDTYKLIAAYPTYLDAPKPAASATNAVKAK